MGSYIITGIETSISPSPELCTRIVKLKGLIGNYGTNLYSVNQHGNGEINAYKTEPDIPRGVGITVKEHNNKPLSLWEMKDIIEDN